MLWIPKNIISNESNRIIEDIYPLNSRVYIETEEFIYGEFSCVHTQSSNGINGIRINARLFYPMANERQKYNVNKSSKSSNKKTFPDLGILALSPDISKKCFTNYIADIIGVPPTFPTNPR